MNTNKNTNTNKNVNDTKHYCTYEEVHSGTYDCGYCGENYECLGKECIYRENFWRIRVNVYKSHLDWDTGRNKVATFDYLTLGNKLPEKAENVIKRIQKMYSEDIWCDYTLRLVPHSLSLKKVVDNFITELAKQWVEEEYGIKNIPLGITEQYRGFSESIWNNTLDEARELMFKRLINEDIMLKEEVEF